jgi:hypothetical protein
MLNNEAIVLESWFQSFGYARHIFSEILAIPKSSAINALIHNVQVCWHQTS